MKAAQIGEYGDPSVIHINDIDMPTVDPGKVLIEVKASSLNPFDSALRFGYMKNMIHLELPVTLGGDIAGVVAEVGEGVVGLSVGDKVYGQAAVVAHNSGAFAEFASTRASEVAMMPNNTDYRQAASIPLVGVSAQQSLTEHITLKAGQSIFIHGGAGGVGTIAIQIAKHLGAHIATTATGDDIDFVKSLGAGKVIDYRSQNFSDVLNDFDAVFDTVGGDFNKTLAVLKPGGIAVSMIATADEARAAELRVTAMIQATKVTTAALDSLRELIETDVVATQVTKVYPLDQIQDAFRARESGGVRGKIVIEIGAGA